MGIRSPFSDATGGTTVSIILTLTLTQLLQPDILNLQCREAILNSKVATFFY